MFPSFTQNNFVDSSKVNPVLSCEFGLGTYNGNIFLSDFNNLGFGKFCQIMFRAVKTPTFFNHIMGIFGGCTKKKMGRSNAQLVIATGAVMANGHAIGDFPKGEFISSAVGVNVHGFTVNLFDSITVAIFAHTSLPQPTLATCLINVAPKGFFGGNTSSVLASTATEFSGSISDTVGFYKERNTAILANIVRGFRGFCVKILHVIPSFQGVTTPRLLAQCGGFCC